jgi:hypothetical protein
MGERHPGWVNDIDAPEARLATGLLVAAQGTGDTLDPLRVRTGIRDGAGYPGLVTLGTNKVTVNPFQAVLADPAQPADGPYLVTLDAAKELSIGAANASLYRMDLVVAEVAGTNPGFQVTVYAGENSASATPPRPTVTNPLTFVLAEITVPPPDKGAPALKDTRRFTAALNGIIPVRNEADRPPNPYGSMIIYRLDTGVLEVRKNNAWVAYRPPRDHVDEWHAPAALSNNWKNYGSGFVPFGYTITEDSWVRLRGLIKGGTSPVVWQLPEDRRPVAQHIFAVAVGTTGVQATLGRVDIDTLGRISVTFGGNAWVSLDGISFATY